MVKIELETLIEAPIERVFDLARSIDLHKSSTKKTNEEAVAGKTAGLIEFGETVTWRAKHFGLYQKLTVQVTAFDKPNVFEDRMIKGAFKHMRHVHRFSQLDSSTKMIDEFEFTSPFGLLGKLANQLFLKKYMTTFLIEKNLELKRVAESEDWHSILSK